MSELVPPTSVDKNQATGIILEDWGRCYGDAVAPDVCVKQRKYRRYAALKSATITAAQNYLILNLRSRPATTANLQKVPGVEDGDRTNTVTAIWTTTENATLP
jgi:hypothetical protein